jgi:hypothetical protein
VFWVGGMCSGVYFQVVDVATFGLTKFEHFYSVFLGFSFDIDTKEYAASKWAYRLICSQFFWLVDVLELGN